MADRGASTIRAAHIGLTVLTLINLFNYLDRFVVAALVESLKADLHLSDTQMGWLATGFIVVYMATSPFFGALGDQRSRTRLIAAGVTVWSVATAMAGLAKNFGALFAARAAVGIGEAAYGTIAPALIADYFPKEKRGRVFAIFFAAIPIGSALGYVVGGLMDKYYGWRAAFYVAGLPGLLLAALALRLFDPPRGAQDTEEGTAHIHAAHGAGGTWRAYIELTRNRPYLLTILGYAAYTFAIGGIAFWMPAFLERVRGVPKENATVLVGSIVVVTGFIGTFAGGWLGDYLLRYTKQAYLWVSGWATLLAAPFIVLIFTEPSPAIYLTAMVIAQILMFVSTGPINSAIVNLVSPVKRATAVAACNFAIHLFGDVPSPPLIGILSDKTSLEKAVLVVPVAVVISGLIWLGVAWRAQREDGARTVRWLFREVFALALRIFFSRIEVVGREQVPADGPVIFVLNHPNGLIDPLFILCFAPRRVSFLAKDTLFRMPVISFLVKAFDSLPVHRQQDGQAAPAQNRQTFERARALLARGGTLAVFPEGASHSDPKLRPLKSGAARIALGAASAPTESGPRGTAMDKPLRIVPAGLYFTEKGTFRSAALVYFGAPITVEPTPLGSDGEPPREPVQSLTAHIEKGLSDVMLHAEQKETLAFIARAEKIFSSDAGVEADDLSQTFELRRRFATGYATLRARAPERLAALQERIDRYHADLAHARLDPHSLPREQFTLPGVARYTLKSMLLFMALVPAAVIGALIHYPAYRLTGFFALRLSKGEEDLPATIKVLASLLFFPLTWLLVGFWAGIKFGSTAALSTLVAAPLTGLAALIFMERLDQFMTGARALRLSTRRRGAFDRLRAERSAIRAEILKLSDEIGATSEGPSPDGVI